MEAPRKLLTIVIALVLALWALPAVAHEEVESEDGTLEVEVDRPIVAVGDPIELEAEYELEHGEEGADDVDESGDLDEDGDDGDDGADGDDDSRSGSDGESDLDEDDTEDTDDLGDDEDEEHDTDDVDEVEEEREGESAEGSPVTFEVNWGDDASSTSLTITKWQVDQDAEELEIEVEAEGTHTYASVGTYTIEVTATPDGGTAVTVEIDVEVVEGPVPYDVDTDDLCEDDLDGDGFDDEDEDLEDDDDFDDVEASLVHAASIDCLDDLGAVNGKDEVSFGPGDEVTRAQMATFIVTVLELAGYPLPAATTDHFGDDDGSPHEGNINRLAEAGLVDGDGEGNFAPDETLTRDQMAAMLIRALEDALGEIEEVEDFFDDDEGSVHEGEINAAAAAGIATGRSLGQFDPHGQLDRGQATSFLVRLLAALRQAD